jgi:hypothetical protein
LTTRGSNVGREGSGGFRNGGGASCPETRHGHRRGCGEKHDTKHRRRPQHNLGCVRGGVAWRRRLPTQVHQNTRWITKRDEARLPNRTKSGNLGTGGSLRFEPTLASRPCCSKSRAYSSRLGRITVLRLGDPDEDGISTRTTRADFAMMPQRRRTWSVSTVVPAFFVWYRWLPTDT